MKEIWKDVKDFEGFYQVSNLGRVKRLPRDVPRSDNKKCFLAEKIMKHRLDMYGYPKTSLNVSGKSKTVRVHKLVATAFIPNPDNKEQINHIDGNKLNNCVENLEWVTHQEHNKHTYTNDITVSENRGIRLNTNKAKSIRILFKEGWSYKNLAEKYEVSESLIRLIVKNKRWRHPE